MLQTATPFRIHDENSSIAKNLLTASKTGGLRDQPVKGSTHNGKTPRKALGELSTNLVNIKRQGLDGRNTKPVVLTVVKPKSNDRIFLERPDNDAMLMQSKDIDISEMLCTGFTKPVDPYDLIMARADEIVKNPSLSELWEPLEENYMKLRSCDDKNDISAEIATEFDFTAAMMAVQEAVPSYRGRNNEINNDNMFVTDINSFSFDDNS